MIVSLWIKIKSDLIKCFNKGIYVQIWKSDKMEYGLKMLNVWATFKTYESKMSKYLFHLSLFQAWFFRKLKR